MDLLSEIEYHRQVPELAEPVAPTPEEKFAEYREAPHRAWKPLHRFLADIHEAGPSRLLELGCGAGQLTTRLAKAGYRITALELSPELLEATRQRAELDGVSDRVVPVEADIETFEPGTERFDLAVVKLVLHHVDLTSALSVITRSLIPEGVAVIWEPVAFSPFLQRLRDLVPVSKDVSPNERQLTRDDLTRISERFEETEIRYYYLLARIRRLLPGGSRWRRLLDLIERGDAWLLDRFPPLRHFAGSVVIRCRIPKRSATVAA